MDNNQVLNQNDNNQYLSMVNYLISQLNKAKVNPFPVKNQPSAIPIFLYEFFVFELYLPSELLKFVKQPILAFRLLDFPTLTLEGNLNIQRQSVIFNQGKSSFFEMELLDLKDNLLNQPMYIMFLDLNHGNIKIIGNCRLNISLFAYDSFLNYGNGPIPDPRRNILQLYDSTMEKVGEFEMSLIIRREYYKFDKNIEVTENKKTVLIKKAKKPRQILSKEQRENLMYKGKERPKQQKEIIYDNNKISNSKYMKPQFINNIILEKNDTAFNAHPVNKEIIIKPKNEEQQESTEKTGENKNKKKGKVMKCNAQTETDLIPGVNIPINNVDYNKKNIKKKKPKPKANNNFNDINYYQNNQMLINSMYNKYQTDSKYNFPQYELRPKNYNNNYNNSNSNNFNNYYNNQNNNNQNSNYETQSSQKNQNKNTYLNFLTNLKSQINNYTNNLINDKKMIQKVKDERHLNQQNNSEINMNMNNNINESNNVNDINNKIEDFKKPENIEKSENKENSEIKEESGDKENNNNNNINNNEIKNNIENNNNINNFNEKKGKEIISEESKEDEEYNDFVKSEKSNISNNKKNTDEILDNKFNNFNADFEEKKEGENQENINNNNINNNINNNNNNIPSDNEIKEDSSLEENKNNGNQIESGEINEEIDDNLISTKKQIKASNNVDINSASENKGLASSSTEKIENLLK